MAEIPNAFANCRKVLLDRLKEPAPGRIQLLTGPRQVGKTTLLLEIAAEFGDRAVYAAVVSRSMWWRPDRRPCTWLPAHAKVWPAASSVYP